jgi:hypothetical protein
MPTRDGNIQLLTGKHHYVFNLAWIKAFPSAPTKSNPPLHSSRAVAGGSRKLRETALNKHLFSSARFVEGRTRQGSGMPRSRRIFLARKRLISVWRGTAERRFVAGLPHHE